MIPRKVLVCFRGDAGGATAVMFGALLAVMLGAVGLGVDAYNLTRTRAALQAAVDGAALAAGADFHSDIKTLDKVVQRYLTENGVSDGLVTNLSVKTAYEEDGAVVSVSADGQADTLFMGLAGIPQVEVGVSAKATRARTKPLELALVLDASFSMTAEIEGRVKWDSLVDAATNLADVVIASPVGKVGLVTFGDAFKTDASKFDSDPKWLDIPYAEPSLSCVYHCDPKFPIIPPKEIELTWACVQDGVPTTCKSNQMVDPGQCTIVKSCHTEYSKWPGWVGLRYGARTTIANPTNPPYSVSGGNGYILDLSRDREYIHLNIQYNLSGSKMTYIPGGLVWGWNLLDPEEPFTEAMSYATMAEREGTKALVLMTDGENTGYLDEKSVVRDVKEKEYTQNELLSPAEQQKKIDESDSDTRELCKNIKAAGIVIYTVAFDVTAQQTNDPEKALALISNCATDPSKSFVANNNQQLADAFGKIAASLQSVRLVQ